MKGVAGGRAPGPALGLLELTSIARGVVVADAALKRAPAVLLSSRTLSGGRHLVVLEGDVASVQEAMAAGREAAGDKLLDRVELAMADDAVWPMLERGGLLASADWADDPAAEAAVIVETATVSAAIAAADAAAKPDFPVNQAGFVIHSAVHGARPELGCVLHTHTRAGMAVSAMKDGLLPLTQTSMRFYGAIGYHDYEEPTADINERERLARDLGRHNAIILRNHGLLACGRTIGEAFNLMYWLENACKVQVDVLGSAVGYTLPSPALAESLARRYQPTGPVMSRYAALEWQALLRKLDRESPGFRD